MGLVRLRAISSIVRNSLGGPLAADWLVCSYLHLQR